MFVTQVRKENPSFKQCNTMLFRIIQRYKDNENLFNEPFLEQWQSIFNTIANCLYNLKKEDNTETIKWKEAFSRLSYLNEKTQVFNHSKAYAEIAFRARSYNTAIKIWDTLLIQKSESYYFAKSEVLEYPKNIEWLFKAERVEKVAEIIKDEDIQTLPEENRNKLISFYISDEKYRSALNLLKKFPVPKLLIDLYKKVKNKNVYLIILDTLELIIKDVVKNKNWDEIIEIFIQDKINAKVVDDANRILIKQLASKDSIIDAPNKVKEKLTSYLRTVLVDKKWKGIVDVITAGTAFEKTVSERRNADVLDFYELIWAKNRIPVKTRELNFSKERWLNRKIILANTIIG